MQHPFGAALDEFPGNLPDLMPAVDRAARRGCFGEDDNHRAHATDSLVDEVIAYQSTALSSASSKPSMGAFATEDAETSVGSTDRRSSSAGAGAE